ncbi:chemotaxis response regulator protein-glutamate methylesterase [soil metagenome]
MAKIRVLIVDDAAVFRRALSAEFASDPELDVIGTAADGRIALTKLTQVNPDVVILDVEMPVLDGLGTLKEIRKSHPKLPVIMFSALTERGAEATLDALALGASDYFTKPSGSGGLEASLQVIREELIPQIKALCRKPTVALQAPAAPIAPGFKAPAEVVAIATSTGGPNALAEVFASLPADLAAPIVIVQHMPPMFTKLLAERMAAQYAVKTMEGHAGDVLKPGHAYIAPGDYHMALKRDGRSVSIQLHQEPRENSCRPAADVLFRSVAQAYGPTSLAVVMTGMGQDGLRGCEAIKTAGGDVVIQDEPTSVVWGMPGSVKRAGLADRVLPLSLIASEIVRRVRVRREGVP